MTANIITLANKISELEYEITRDEGYIANYRAMLKDEFFANDEKVVKKIEESILGNEACIAWAKEELREVLAEMSALVTSKALDLNF